MNAPEKRLSLALGRPHATAALLALLDAAKPIGATDLTRAIGGWAGSGISVAKHLQSAGLSEVKEIKGIAGKAAYRIWLTPAGKRVAQALTIAAKHVP